MPPQAGQRMFQDISKMASRAPCRKAAMTSSSLSLCLAAKASALIRRRSRSGPSSMSFSIALTGFGFADRRKALRRVLVSLESFMSQSGSSPWQLPCAQEKRKASDRCAKPSPSPMPVTSPQYFQIQVIRIGSTRNLDGHENAEQNENHQNKDAELSVFGGALLRRVLFASSLIFKDKPNPSDHGRSLRSFHTSVAFPFESMVAVI